jgi:hypothetical protein
MVAGLVDAKFTRQAVDHLLTADPLWYAIPDRVPQHLLLAARCVGEVRNRGAICSSGNRCG